MKQGLGSVIAAREPTIDPLELDAFLRQPQVQFTIDCLIDQFEKWRISQRGVRGQGAKWGVGAASGEKSGRSGGGTSRSFEEFPNAAAAGSHGAYRLLRGRVPRAFRPSRDGP